jgi:hypothetical protein
MRSEISSRPAAAAIAPIARSARAIMLLRLLLYISLCSLSFFTVLWRRYALL